MLCLFKLGDSKELYIEIQALMVASYILVIAHVSNIAVHKSHQALRQKKQGKCLAQTHNN